MKKPSESKRIYDMAENLANSMSDKPYASKTQEKKENKVNLSISILESLKELLEDEAIENKRKKLDQKNVSAIITEMVRERYNK